MPDILTLRAAKFWIGLVGVLVTAVIASTPDVPAWFKALSAALAAAGVYVTPNAAVPSGEPTDEEVGR